MATPLPSDCEGRTPIAAERPPAGTITVRPARPDDLPDLQEVARRTWRATYTGLIPNADIERFLERHYSLEALGRALERLGEGMLVAAVDDQVVGYATCGVNRENSGELFAIYVLPEWQRRGVGRRLWQRAIKHLRSLGLPEMVVWVLANNEPARRFYERQGATLLGNRAFPVSETPIEEVGYVVPLAGR